MISFAFPFDRVDQALPCLFGLFVLRHLSLLLTSIDTPQSVRSVYQCGIVQSARMAMGTPADQLALVVEQSQPDSLGDCNSPTAKYPASVEPNLAPGRGFRRRRDDQRLPSLGAARSGVRSRTAIAQSAPEPGRVAPCRRVSRARRSIHPGPNGIRSSSAGGRYSRPLRIPRLSSSGGPGARRSARGRVAACCRRVLGCRAALPLAGFCQPAIRYCHRNKCSDLSV